MQPTQPSTFTIHTSQHVTQNCKKACLPATAILPTLKTIFFGNSSALVEKIYECK